MTGNDGDGWRDDLHEEAHLLLPWYVNGTLDARERESVESHLADCAACREEVRACREVARGMSVRDQVSPTAHRQLARLMTRIDEVEAAGEDPADGGEAVGDGASAFGRPAGSWWSALPRGGRRLVALQLAAILLLAAGLAWRLWPQPAPPALFHTLSDAAPGAAGASGGDGLRLRLVFAEDATERQIRDLLLEAGAEIVAGPSPFGVYTVEVPAAPAASGDALRSTLERLRAHPVVRFAEPAAGRGR